MLGGLGMEPDRASTFKQSELFAKAMSFAESELPVTRSIQLAFAFTPTSVALEVRAVLAGCLRRPRLENFLG